MTRTPATPTDQERRTLRAMHDHILLREARHARKYGYRETLDLINWEIARREAAAK